MTREPTGAQRSQVSRIEERISVAREANASNHSAGNRESWNRIEKSAGRCCFMKTVKGTSQVHGSTWEPHRDDVRLEQLWKLQTMFRAGVTVRTCFAGTGRNTH